MRDIIRLPTGAGALFVPAPATGKHLSPAIVIVHGWNSRPYSSSSYALLRPMLLDAGFATLSVFLRGHEQAEGDLGSVTRQDHLDDVKAAFTWLSQRSDINPDRVGALGVSYGCYLLAIASASCPFPLKALALRAPVLYPDAGWDEPTCRFTDNESVREWRQSVRTPEECKALAGLGSFSGSLLIVASEHDESVPPAVVESYLLAALRTSDQAAFVISGASHVLSAEEREIFFVHSAAFFRSRLRESL
ncbi:MAG: CocE/NonD family hydrolase [Patescibacteria group bacterium]